MATVDIGKSRGRRERPETLVTLMNPNPETLISEVYERAGVRRVRVKDGAVFALEVQIGTDPTDREKLELQPGETLDLVAAKAADAIAEKGHRGLCILNPADPYQSMIDGLTRAVDFWSVWGDEALIKFQTFRGHTERELEVLKNKDYAPFLLNRAKTEIVLEEIDRLNALREEWFEENATKP